MRSNPLVTMGLIGVAVVAVFLVAVVVIFGGDDEAGVPAGGTVVLEPLVGGEPLGAETAAALGIEADTPADTLRTVSSQFRETNERLGRLEEANQELRRENEGLRDVQDRIAADVAGTVREEMGGWRAQIEELLSRGGGMLGTAGDAGSDSASRADLGGGLGIVGEPQGLAGGVDRESRDLVWVSALGDDAGFADEVLPWGDGPAGIVPIEEGQADGPPPPRPVYTVPKNSTLVGATAFTALVGRVPVGEEARVTDPYQFKLLIGSDNLAANGHEIPELAYAVASGRSIGDWTLGCVSGEVQSMTFVFADGRIVTLPPPADVSAGGGGSSSGVRLGSLSDDYGNPCVAGRRVTNAASYLLQSTGALTLGAASEGLAAAQTTRVAGAQGQGAIAVVDGDVGRFALGRGLSGAAQEVARWVLARQAQEYDVVYVPPGARVAVHVEEELPVDYDPVGRMVRHEDVRESYRALD